MKKYIYPEVVELEMDLEGLLCESGEIISDNAGMLNDNDWNVIL